MMRTIRLTELAGGSLFIYGMGARGRISASCLADHHGIRVDGMVVSDGYKRVDIYTTPHLNEIPVYELSDLSHRFNVASMTIINTVDIGKEMIEDNVRALYGDGRMFEMSAEDYGAMLAPLIDEIWDDAVNSQMMYDRFCDMAGDEL